jgi:ABC-type transport system involved in multi-copper enzyme maturation permease subunit
LRRVQSNKTRRLDQFLLVSEETGSGTIRQVLATPVHRWELFLAKAVAGLVYMVVLSMVALVLSAVLAGIHRPFGAVSDSFGIVYSLSKAMKVFLTGWALSWIPLSALVMYGLLISTTVRSPGAAVTAAIGILILIDFTKHLVGLDPYIFTRHITYPWLVLQQFAQGMDYQWGPEVRKMIELSGASAATAFCAGLVLFVRQDLNH